MSVQSFGRRALIDVRIAPSGAWVVRDEHDHRGGRFRNRQSAMRFIRREFGVGARLRFRPWLSGGVLRAA